MSDIDTQIASGLTPQQYRFVEEMLLDPSNQGKAAIRAGYSIHSAKGIASNLMADPKVRAVIDERQRERAQRLGITEDRVLQEIALIAFANVQDVMETNEDGDTTVNLKHMPRDVAAALGEISITTKKGKTTTKTAKVRLHDKIAALDKLGKHLGMFKEKVEHSGVLTLEQLVKESMLKDDLT